MYEFADSTSLKGPLARRHIDQAGWCRATRCLSLSRLPSRPKYRALALVATAEVDGRRPARSGRSPTFRSRCVSSGAFVPSLPPELR